MKHKFAVFILSHGRADRLFTYKTLRADGYTGKIYIIVDNEDETVSEYKTRYDNVIVFDKLKASKTFDAYDNFDDRRTIVYARNANFDIAKDLGLDYFLQLDDDYTSFAYNYDNEMVYNFNEIKDLDSVFETMIGFMERCENVKSIAFAQGGDFVGGPYNGFASSINLQRKCMNSFFMSTKRRVKFVGRINEDVNTYVGDGSKGDIFLTYPRLRLNQKQTQSNAGGMSDMYEVSGTYVKSFYTVLANPSCVKVKMMRTKFSRLHHSIKWNNAVPKIISEEFKKK